MSRLVYIATEVDLVAEVEETSCGPEVLSAIVSELKPSTLRKILDQYQSDVLRDERKALSNEAIKIVPAANSNVDDDEGL